MNELLKVMYFILLVIIYILYSIFNIEFERMIMLMLICVGGMILNNKGSN